MTDAQKRAIATARTQRWREEHRDRANPATVNRHLADALLFALSSEPAEVMGRILKRVGRLTSDALLVSGYPAQEARDAVKRRLQLTLDESRPCEVRQATRARARGQVPGGFRQRTS